MVYHMTLPGGIDSICRNTGPEHPNKKVGFLLSNGELDQFDWSWSVPRADGIKALAYFVETGDRDPSLCWIVDPSTLEKPASEAGGQQWVRCITSG